MTNLYKEGVVPPEALSWNDADDNNGFHEKLFMMDFDGTLSTELAMIKDTQAFMHDMKTIAPQLKNDGTPMKTQVNAGGGFIPKGAKNVEVAKDFMKYFMQPKVMNENLKGGLGRWLPAIPSAGEKRPVLAEQCRRAVPEALRRGRRPSIRPCRCSRATRRPGVRRTPSNSGARPMPTSSRMA